MDDVLRNVETYSHGKLNFMVGLCESINLPNVIDKHLEQHQGRPAEIPYSVLAEMMLVNMCDDHHPLYILNEYFMDKDLEGIFHYPINLSQINDDRFEGYLDALYKAGPRKIFSELAANAFATYGITVKNINYDTTSKVMWGLYDTPDGKEDVIAIDFGHSKDKREDKKQLKMGIGVAEGVIVDAKVLSGNKDDKTYNFDNLDDVNGVLENLNISKESFFYIADSTLFTEDNLNKAKSKDIKVITRIPDNTNVVKTFINDAISNMETLTPFTIQNSKDKNVEYKICERNGKYKGIDLKYAVCYSYGLVDSKKRTIEKNIVKEFAEIEKIIKLYNKRDFACLIDTEKEIEKLISKEFKKLKYHNVSLSVVSEEKKRRGRPSKEEQNQNIEYKYSLNINASKDEKKIDYELTSSCIFVLCSNDTAITAEEILKEYKTQDSVEKKFQQLKSPHFVNALYLKTPERIEAMAYMILISIMVLSVAEHVVRRGLKKDNDKIIGPGKIKMSHPTLVAIFSIFINVRIRVVQIGKRTEREFVRPLNDSILKVLKYLDIPESIFVQGFKKQY